MLPDPNGQPPSLDQQRVGLCIAFAVAPNLWTPIFGVCTSGFRVQSTAVPEASIDEYRNALSRKDNIRNAAGGMPWRHMDPIAEPTLMQRPT
jgi:hypothetical protein